VFVLLERMPTDRQHDHVRAQVLNGRHIGGGAQAQVDFQARQLQLVPAGDAGDLVTLRRLGAVVICPPMNSFFSNRVTSWPRSAATRALPSRQGRHRPPPPCVWPGGLLDDVRHAHVFTGGRGVLDAQHIQALVLTVDAVVGADALFDLVDLAHLDLGDQVRVGDVGAGHADHVHIAAFKDARGLVRVLDVLRVQHRDLDHFLDTGRQVQERLGG
jgi:hypothetical protein